MQSATRRVLPYPSNLLVSLVTLAFSLAIRSRSISLAPVIPHLPEMIALHVIGGALIGVGVGLVSSLLGVAGGELLVPALILIFGADIKTAGSASILISLGVVLIGLWRHWHAGTIPLWRGAQRMTAAMAAGSILGALIGGLAVAYAPVAFLKVLLGCVLLAAAAKTALHKLG
jgi:uncharacterized membrane protein YfcA